MEAANSCLYSWAGGRQTSEVTDRKTDPPWANPAIILGSHEHGRGGKEKAGWPVLKSVAEGGVRERDRQVFFNFSTTTKKNQKSSLVPRQRQYVMDSLPSEVVKSTMMLPSSRLRQHRRNACWEPRAAPNACLYFPHLPASCSLPA